ncbi:hypothetical protein EVAR_131_1 [Eumeta japonica]|uniref:Uncharacterized protein n=1 Tax=Eumeta variegata TaxID=151549 RepID=A0A4C1S8E2_EUMVA|nr:hypothetical protein EVAR_131_1 [Eumeta japonica]
MDVRGASRYVEGCEVVSGTASSIGLAVAAGAVGGGRRRALRRSLTQLCAAGAAGAGAPHAAVGSMQLPGGPGPPPPPPLAPLWERVVRAGALPPDLDVDRLYVAIRDRLRHPEPEVRLHALRVLADALPIAGRALTFPFDETVDNLGHGSPNVRKAALDALKVFCAHCEEPECAARALLLDECMYRGETGPPSRDADARANVITGLVLSIPSLLNILKRRDPSLPTLPIFRVLGDMLFDPVHRDVALRSLVKLRRVCGPREYMDAFSRLDPHVQHKFRTLYEMHDEDAVDVYYARKKAVLDREDERNGLVATNQISGERNPFHGTTSTDSSSEDSFVPRRDDSVLHNGFARVIIETEIKIDGDTAITMTVLEENEADADSDRVGTSEDDHNFDGGMLKYSDGDSEDMDVVVSQKRVRFGGESVKIRTPDSDNLANSEDDKATGTSSSTCDTSVRHDISHRVDSVPAVSHAEMKSELDKDIAISKPKRSGIPLPIIQTKRVQTAVAKPQNDAKQKSKSLSELYDYFRNRNDIAQNKTKGSGFALTLSEVRSPEKIPSPIPEHGEVEVLHNLQRSPLHSPRRQTTLQLEHDGKGRNRENDSRNGSRKEICIRRRKDKRSGIVIGDRIRIGIDNGTRTRFVLNVMTMSPREDSILSPRPPTPLLAHYDWETGDILPQHVVQQLHNTENWIAVVRAADQLHSALLKPENVAKVEPAALSLVRHMWALSETVPAARAPAEGAVCALLRSSSSDCARRLLPALISRLTRAPPPAALPHALLQRLALHHLIDLLFDPDMTSLCGETSRVQSGQLRAALCVARAAGPAAVLAAVRRRLAGTARAQLFCQKGTESKYQKRNPYGFVMSVRPTVCQRHFIQKLEAMLRGSFFNLKINKDFKSSGISFKKASLGTYKCMAVGKGPLRPRLATPLTLSENHFEHDRLRERLSRPVEKENARFAQITRSSQLPVAVRRRARSTPPPAPPMPPRRLRPLPDSAPVPGIGLRYSETFRGVNPKRPFVTNGRRYSFNLSEAKWIHTEPAALKSPVRGACVRIRPPTRGVYSHCLPPINVGFGVRPVAGQRAASAAPLCFYYHTVSN